MERSASTVLWSSGSHGPLSGPVGFQNVCRQRPPLSCSHSASSSNHSARCPRRGLLVSQTSISGASRPRQLAAGAEHVVEPVEQLGLADPAGQRVPELPFAEVVDVQAVPVQAGAHPGLGGAGHRADDGAVADVRAPAQVLHVLVHGGHAVRADVVGIAGQVGCLVPGGELHARRRRGDQARQLLVQLAGEQVGGDGPDGQRHPRLRHALLGRPDGGDKVVLVPVRPERADRDARVVHGVEHLGVGSEQHAHVSHPPAGPHPSGARCDGPETCRTPARRERVAAASAPLEFSAAGARISGGWHSSGGERGQCAGRSS